jgi:cell division protein FtsN
VAPSPSTAVTAKPAVATPPIAAESRPAAGTVWYVQIGSFAEAGNAQTTLSLLQNIGYRGESTRIASSAGKALFRVRLGPYPTEPVARQALDKVSRQGYPQARLAAEARP